MSRTGEFEQVRPLLFAIAHRILGSPGAARHAVHTAWLRYEAAPAVPADPRDFLTALITRTATDALHAPPTAPGPATPAPAPQQSAAPTPPTPPTPSASPAGLTSPTSPADSAAAADPTSPAGESTPAAAAAAASSARPAHPADPVGSATPTSLADPAAEVDPAGESASAGPACPTSPAGPAGETAPAAASSAHPAVPAHPAHPVSPTAPPHRPGPPPSAAPGSPPGPAEQASPAGQASSPGPAPRPGRQAAPAPSAGPADPPAAEPPGPPVPPAPLSASAAAVLFLERLPPLERAVFVLREVFGRTLAQTASAVGCSPAACRRLAAAVREAGTGPGGVPPWPGLIAGAVPVSRVLGAVVPALLDIGVTMEPRPPGPRPGAVFRDRTGTVLGVLTLDVLDGRIQTVRWGAAPAACAPPHPEPACPHPDRTP